MVEERVAILHVPDDASGVGIEEESGRVVAPTALGCEGAVDPESVSGSGTHAVDDAVPHVDLAPWEQESGLGAGVVEETEPHRISARTDGEVGSAVGDGRSEDRRIAGGDGPGHQRPFSSSERGEATAAGGHATLTVTIREQGGRGAVCHDAADRASASGRPER